MLSAQRLQTVTIGLLPPVQKMLTAQLLFNAQIDVDASCEGMCGGIYPRR